MTKSNRGNTLAEQFFNTVKAAKSSFTTEDEDKNIVEAIKLRDRIGKRLAKIRAEVEELERAERSREWREVGYEKSRGDNAND